MPLHQREKRKEYSHRLKLFPPGEQNYIKASEKEATLRQKSKNLIKSSRNTSIMGLKAYIAAKQMV